jgi:hypothetical protein
MFRQVDLSQFFLGKSGPFKMQNEQRTQYFKDYEKSKRSRQFLKEWKQNRPWLLDTETGMVYSYCKEQKKRKFIFYRMYKLQTSTPYVKL